MLDVLNVALWITLHFGLSCPENIIPEVPLFFREQVSMASIQSLKFDELFLSVVVILKWMLNQRHVN